MGGNDCALFIESMLSALQYWSKLSDLYSLVKCIELIVKRIIVLLGPEGKNLRLKAKDCPCAGQATGLFNELASAPHLCASLTYNSLNFTLNLIIMKCLPTDN